MWKKILLYIIAIPAGLIASTILPSIFSKILNFFIPFRTITDFLDLYFLKFISGWIAVGIAGLVAPSHRILFASIMLGLNLLAAFYMYSLGDEFNYLFVLGGIAPLVLLVLHYLLEKSEAKNDMRVSD